MQHIGMQRETERGELLANFDSKGIDLRIVQRAPETSACLRFIDPYGDTVLNQLQLPVLISDLEELRGAATEHDFRANIDPALAFLRESEGHHVYIRFVGD